MSVQITESFVNDYKETVMLLAQQRASRFARACTINTYRGEGGRPVNQVGIVDAREKTTRHEDISYNTTPHDARWVYPTRKYYADIIDHMDKLRTIASFESAYAQAGASALERGKDDLIIEAFFADAKTGKAGGTTTPFDTNMQVAATVGASSATGMNTAKLKRARKLLRANEVDLDVEPAYCAISAEQEEELLSEWEIIGNTAGNQMRAPVLEDGRLMRWMGFNFIHSERLDTNSSSQRRCPFWVPSGMHLGMWEDTTITIREAAKKHPGDIEVYVGGDFGATRIEETKVGDIVCAES